VSNSGKEFVKVEGAAGKLDGKESYMRIVVCCLMLYFWFSNPAVHAMPPAEEGAIDLGAVKLSNTDPVAFAGCGAPADYAAVASGS
jgi:hypothetical protein